MEWVKKTMETQAVMEASGVKRYGIEALVLDLMEEVGELANAILIEEGHKPEKRRRAELVDSVCDVLYDLLRIADHYKIDLEKEYQKVLEQLKERGRKGEL